MLFKLTAVALSASMLAGSAFAAGNATPVVKTAELNGGEILVDANGMTLYTFDNDGENASNCYDQCAVNWPPLTVGEGMGVPAGFDVITRNDGTEQVVHGGDPLYLWVHDSQPGDVSGDGVHDVWHIAHP